MKKLRSQPWVTLNHATKAKGFNFDGIYPVKHPSKPLYGSVTFDKDGHIWLATKLCFFNSPSLSETVIPTGKNAKYITGWERTKYARILILSESILAQMMGRE